jgi:hypothetical protein
MRDTIELAREVYGAQSQWAGAPLDRLEKLVALVRADEREACAEVADYMAGRCKHPDEIADAIRARGNT